MTLVTTSENTDAQHSDIQLTLSGPEAERLRATVPWLLRALADRPTATPEHNERRRTARAALEPLLSALSGPLQQAQESGESQ